MLWVAGRGSGLEVPALHRRCRMNVTARQGDTLDLLCWRHLGATRGVVELALELNRGIADAGAVLAEGTVVTLPDRAPPAATAIDAVRLWD